MKQTCSKIVLILLIAVVVVSCNAVKHLKPGEELLTKNIILVDGEPLKDEAAYNQLVQKPNTQVLGIPFSLHIFNFAKTDPDSVYMHWEARKPKRKERLTKILSNKQREELKNSYVGINNWIKKVGEAPVVIDTSKMEKSRRRLERYYARQGWFNTKANYTILPDTNQRAQAQYTVLRQQPYILDSITTTISSPVLDSLYKQTKNLSFLKEGEQYLAENFENEIDRLSFQFRNSGLYHFDTEYVTFEADTVKTGHRALINYIIPDRTITTPDSTFTKPFKIYKVNKVNIVTDYQYSNRQKTFKDSVSFNAFKLYGFDPIKYRPKAITDAVAITPGKIFRDVDRSLTYNQMSNLNVFRYPTISYSDDPDDPEGDGLIADILLTPLKKYNLDLNFDAATSTVQEFGIGFSTTFSIRNVFRGAETLELSARGSLGSSKDNAESDSSFFNISDVGGDAALSFPRILFPFNTDKLIPKYMNPRTRIGTGFGFQNNIGLDRQNISVDYNYQWKPSKAKTWTVNLANIQYVRNLNTSNYFNVYRSSYDLVNSIARDVGYTFNNPDSNDNLEVPGEINQFIIDALGSNPDNLPFSRLELQELSSIEERRERLSEDNLIFSTSVSWLRDSRTDIYDKSFTRIRWRLESAGNFISTLTRLADTETNEQGNRKALGVVFSQYFKVEGDFIRHWELSPNTVFAVRAFGGIAIPYGNSNSIPFIRSYFGGGANDNRGWRPYDLGPGSSGSVLDFNEANFKLAFNAEYRFTLLGALKGALFVDAGNIWNVLDNQEDEAFKFSGVKDLRELAVASGLGIRYDFGFFVFRVDTGFKTHNPARPLGERWFKDYNFANAVFNIGINYPF